MATVDVHDDLECGCHPFIEQAPAVWSAVDDVLSGAMRVPSRVVAVATATMGGMA